MQSLNIARVLWIANRSAGSWPGSISFDKLSGLVRQSLPDMELQCSTADSHADVASIVEKFLSAPSAAAVVVGGGGGTLRAAIESAIRCDALTRTIFAPLRLGSGNVLARRLRVPKDPDTGMLALCDAISRQCIVSITVMRCTYQHERHLNGPCTAYAAALVGLGQFGRVPTDLAAHRRTLQWVRGPARKLFGIEGSTNYEYGIALVVRALACVVRPTLAELVAIEYRGSVEQFRLLAGAMLTFPIPGVPEGPTTELFEEGKAVLIPMDRRAALLRNGMSWDRIAHLSRCYTITKDTPLIIRLRDRSRTGFFLDEDPLHFSDSMTLDIAGVAKVVRIGDRATGTSTRL